MILWSINDQIMSVTGWPVPILHIDGGHLENGGHFEFFEIRFRFFGLKNLGVVVLK